MKSAVPLQIRVLDADALRLLCAEPNSSKYAIDAHNRAIEEIGDLSELPKLCALDLSFNRIQTLTNLGTARELRELKLYNNHLTTTKGLRANPNLEGLFLSENQITAIATDLLALAKLKALSLKGNRIERVEHLKSCRLLVSLDLSRNRLAGVAAEGLESLTCLETLNLSDNALRAIGNLSHLVKLEDLNVGHNQLTTLDGQFPPSLATLRVNENRIASLQSLTAPLPTLTELYIHDNELRDLVAVASHFPALESLDVRNNRLRSTTSFQALVVCTALQDIWVAGNPCCSSSSYVLDIVTALPELKTLDALSDAQLARYVEGLKNGSIAPMQTGIVTPRPHTPSSYRPGTASRPSSSSGIGSRPITPSGRPGTPDGSSSAPVFHKPSTRTGTLMKLVSPAEIEKAKADVSERLRRMKDLLHRVGDNASVRDAIDARGRSDSSVSSRRVDDRRVSARLQQSALPSQHVERPSAVRSGESTAVSSGSSTDRRTTQQPIKPTSSRPEATAVAPETTSQEAVVSAGSTATHALSSSRTAAAPRARKPKCRDAGTDPLEPLMSSRRPAADWLTPAPAQAGHEIETQTSAPPAPVAMSMTDAAASTSSIEQQLKRASSTDGIQTEPEPQLDGDLIEQEMKAFLLQHMRDDDDGDRDNNNSYEPSDADGSSSDAAKPEDDPGNQRSSSESPRLESIKTAEQRAPPTPRSRQGYRAFRMPTSRPSSSSSAS